MKHKNKSWDDHPNLYHELKMKFTTWLLVVVVLRISMGRQWLILGEDMIGVWGKLAWLAGKKTDVSCSRTRLTR